jgi:hypothetical protein
VSRKGSAVYICPVDTTPKPHECERGGTHTPQPTGYLAWFEWADEMSKTHRSTRCRYCGLFAVWVPRRPLDPKP